MSKSQVRLEELKQDADPSGKQNLLEIWDLYRTQIIIGVVGLVLIVIAARFAVTSVQEATANRWVRINAIYQMYDRALSAADEASREEQLSQVMTDCQALWADAPASVPGLEALFVQSRVQLIQGDLDKAVTSFEQYIARVDDAEARVAGHIAKGVALADRYFLYEKQEDFELAKAAFEKARNEGRNEEGGPNAYGREAVMRLGILHEQAGQYEEAKGYLTELTELPSFEEELKRVVGDTEDERESDDSRSQQAKSWRERFVMMQRSMSHKALAERYMEEIEETQERY